MVGTVSYMPPEQAMDGEVTPKSDLYSLGAMLYEMVTGRPPFLGDDSVAIIGQHINTPPVAPTWHNGECPRALDALILRLLAKNPSERPESASDVLSALDAINLSEGSPSDGRDGGGSNPHELDSLAGGVFVGRQREMGELKGSLEDALSGRGRLVTLVGEPGIGKTRTAQELATYSGLRGAQVLWGRSYEEQGVPPYWPWVQAIRSYVRDRDPEQLRAEMGSGAADIAEVVSDVRDRLPGLEPAPQLEPDQARFRLFDSIAAFLKTASQRQPLVLVLDDLHWADQPSLLLLQFVARELGGARLLITGTYRDMELSRQHPLAEALGELNRERLFQRVQLRGLTQDDVGRFIEMTSGNSAPRGLVEAVHSQTEGNPLFVTEVVRLLVQEGDLGGERVSQADSWTIRIPEGVREVIGRRLNRLSQRCNEALTVASVVGREFTLPQIRPLVEEVTEDRLFEVLEEALAARVIEELPQSVGHYQFTHALIQETLSDELSTTRKVRLHARFAETLEEMYGDDAESHAAELAHHFAEAQTVLGTEKLALYSRLAGERALAAYAWEEATSQIERGLAAKGVSLEGDDPAKNEEEAKLLSGLGQARVAILPVYRLQEAVSCLRRGFDYFAAIGEIDQSVAIAEYPIPPAAGYRSGMSGLINRALDLVPSTSLAAGRLLSLSGRIKHLEEGDYEGAQEALDRALDIATQEGDVALHLRALADSGEMAIYHGNFQECLDLYAQAADLPKSGDDMLSEAMLHYYAAISSVTMGDSVQASDYAEAGVAVAERLRNRFCLGRSLFAQESVARSLGRWDAMRESSDRGLEIAPRDPRLLMGRTVVESELGENDAAETYLNRIVEFIQLTPAAPTLERAMLCYTVPAVARITGQPRNEFEEDARSILSDPTAAPIIVAMAHTGLSLIAIQNNDRASARELYGGSGLTGIINLIGIGGHRLLGLLSHTMGDLDRSAGHFEDALEFARKANYRPMLAWSCCDYSDMLNERNSEGDRAQAISLLDESLAIASNLGMRPLMERVLSRREILKA